jgi:hypothetical protein
VPITHHDDPRTSAMAEREITAMGERDRQQMTVYAAVVANPGRTSNELSRLIEGMDRHQVAKRLPEIAEAVDGATPRKVILIERGPVRACSVTQRPCVTWWKLGEAPRGESE